MANDTPTIKANAFVAEDTADEAIETPLKTKSTKKNRNALLHPWLIVMLILCICSAGLIAWLEIIFSKEKNQLITEIYKEEFIQSVSDVTNQKLVSTQQELLQISSNSLIQEALTLQDTVQLATISTAITLSHNNIVSFQIIPWDLTGTAGLKALNIEPRNNIELMLLSQAGSKKYPAAEAYIHNKEWLISFTSPVMKNDVVIGILLLTFNKNYLLDIINIPAFTDKAKLVISIKTHKQPLLEVGQGTIPHTQNIALAFTDGMLAASFNPDYLRNLETPFTEIYVAIGALAGFILLMILIAYKTCSAFIKKDFESIRNYIESLSGLHKTKQPDLFVSILSPLLNNIDALNQRTVKIPITTEVNENYKSPQSNKPPEKLGMATVAEKNAFEHTEIFKDYDIRGIAATQLTTDTMVSIGKAIGSQAIALGIKTILTGRDGRASSEKIQYDLSRGITSTGCDVINLGQIPSPVLYFATHKLETHAGIMITGSHNPAEFNGLKIILDNKTLKGQEIQNLLKRIENYDFITGEGKMTRQDISADYIQAVSSDIIIAKPLKVVIDGCNGVGGDISTQLLTMLDCEVTPLFCNVDGTFPNHGPDPSIRANLTDLVNKVKEIGADIGIAFDGDADRMVAITASGEVVSGDQLLMLFAKDIVSRNAGSNVVYDVKCSRNVEKIVSQYGGRAIMTKSGHSNIKAKMQESGALLGGELTGHFFFKERWFGFDDGIYAALRLIELLTTNNSTLEEEITSLPSSHATPELHIPLADPGQARDIIAKLQGAFSAQPCKIDTTDGIRTEFDKGWGLIRASNTTNSLSLRFEAETTEELARIQAIFKTALTDLKSNLTIPL